MKNLILLRCAGCCVILLSCLLTHAQVPQLKINDRTDPNVYLSKLSIDVKVVGNRAITNMTMVFTNKSNRILEGELVFPLPEGISVSRYALDINGKLREAVPVEKEKATQVFEEIERRRVDPGILEQVEGNNFRTRIYPVPANGSRTIAIGYEEELALNNKRSLRYHLALDHQRVIDHFKLDVAVIQSRVKPLIDEEPDTDLRFSEWQNNYTASLTKENFKLSKSLSLTIPRPIDVADVMMQKAGANYYFLVNNYLQREVRARKASDNIAVIWDASLSGLTRNTEKEIELLGKYIEQKKNLRISLYLLNNNFRKNGEYVIIDGDWSSLRKTLEKTVYDGGTDYSKIVLNGSDEYFFFSDGMSSLGYNDFGRVSNPVFAIVSSPRADYSYLQFIAQKTGGSFINLNNLKTAEALKLLSEENLQFLGIKPNSNLSETYPSIATPVVNNFSLAGISTEAKSEITLLFGYGTTVAFEKTITLDFSKQDVGEVNLARAWAQKKIAELDIQFENNKELISFLGRQFSIVTRNTSLIVLETVHDYVRYDIQPPAELRNQFDQIMKGNLSARQNQQHMAMSSALRYLDELAHWWDRGYRAAKPAPLTVPTPAPVQQQPEPGRETGRVDKNSRMNMTDSVTLQEVVVVGYGTQRKLSITGSIPNTTGVDFHQALQGRLPGVDASSRRKIKRAEELGPQDRDDEHATYEVSDYFSRGATIDVKQWMPDRSYLKKIAKEEKSSQYSAYLKLREQYLYTPTFYYDMAQFFFRQQDTITGLQVLTNMAEIDIENHELYKLLGFKLRETGQFGEAVFIFKKVLAWRPMEPQSYRDYGLALADAGKYQQAVDTFYTALKKNYETAVAGLYNGFEEILVTEMNRVIALHKDELNLSGFDQKLIHAMPVDVRVVLSWNKNDTDIDLWVVDPNGEKCYYSNRNTLIGGRISNDFRRGYGPEQYMLKKAIPGKYQVMVNYFGEQQVKLSGPATVMAEIFTHYADGREERKIITLQMEKIDKNNGVMVGEFAFAK
jgi:Ca-activated chloride channel homolog